MGCEGGGGGGGQVLEGGLEPVEGTEGGTMRAGVVEGG